MAHLVFSITLKIGRREGCLVPGFLQSLILLPQGQSGFQLAFHSSGGRAHLAGGSHRAACPWSPYVIPQQWIRGPSFKQRLQAWGEPGWIQLYVGAQHQPISRVHWELVERDQSRTFLKGISQVTQVIHPVMHNSCPSRSQTFAVVLDSAIVICIIDLHIQVLTVNPGSSSAMSVALCNHRWVLPKGACSGLLEVLWHQVT